MTWPPTTQICHQFLSTPSILSLDLVWTAYFHPWWSSSFFLKYRQINTVQFFCYWTVHFQFFRPFTSSLLDLLLSFLTTVQLFFFRIVHFLISGPSSSVDCPLWVFWTVHFGQRPSTFSRFDRPVKPPESSTLTQDRPLQSGSNATKTYSK